MMDTHAVWKRACHDYLRAVFGQGARENDWLIKYHAQEMFLALDEYKKDCRR